MISNGSNELAAYDGGSDFGVVTSPPPPPSGGGNNLPPPKPPKPAKFKKQGGSAQPPPPPPPPRNLPSRNSPPVRTVTLDMNMTSKLENSKAQKEKKHGTPLGFTTWAHNLGYSAGVSNVVFGVDALLWADVIDERPEAGRILFSEEWCGYYCITIGFAGLLFEYYLGMSHASWLFGEDSHGRSPLRAILYFCFAVPCFFSYPTMLPGVAMIMASLANLKAFKKQETIGDGSQIVKQTLCMCECFENGKKDDVDDSSSIKSLTVQEKVIRWINRQQEIGLLGQFIFVSIYILLNVVLWFQRLVAWVSMVNDLQMSCNPSNQFNCVSSFAPWAKAFGQLLNLNCAVVLIPVLRTFFRKLNNLQMDSPGLQKYAPPLRKNIVFHKFVALIVLFATIGHVVFHFLNLWKSPEATLQVFKPSAFATGFIITLAMYLLYSGAQNRVRKAHYEIFWFSHHSFLIFYTFLLAHAPKFWLWGGIPLFAYLFEKWYREYKARKKFYVASAVYKKPVMCISFFPDRAGDFVFKEGQYLHLLAPTLSKYEWHPFTISSPYEDLDCRDGFVTLHIRVQRPGSWTWQLCKMFEEMAPSNAKADGSFELILNHMDNQGGVQRGKHLGPNGEPLIMVDGPHAAPAQHYSEYSELMLVAAGIGVTPSSAIIQSILKHKWKKGFSPETIYFYFVVRHSEIYSFRWFIKLLTEMQKLVVSDFAANSLDPNKHRIQIHLFITRAPDANPGQVIQRQRSLETQSSSQQQQQPHRRAGFDVNIGFKAADLELAMLNPKVSSKQFVNIVTNDANAENRFQNIYIWNGRPNWDDIFAHVKLKRQPTTSKIGVCFCGTPLIGKDLKAYCHKYSSLEDNTRFDLHKENF